MLAFFFIIGLSFLLMASTLINMLGDYLFDVRIQGDRAGLEKWAVQAADELSRGNAAGIDAVVRKAGAELGGRVLLLDKDGKVQSDSFQAAMGRRLHYPEVVSILLSGQTADYGIHSLNSGEAIARLNLLGFSSNDEWASYSTAGIIQSSHVIGVMLLVSSVKEMMNSLLFLQNNMVLLFVGVALAAVIAGMVFSRVLTQPISDMTRVIKSMSKGDLGVRAQVKGSGEIRQLALAFNSMSDQLESLNQTRNQFVSNASHELKTPLATMKIMIESLIYQPDLDPELRTEFLSDVNQEINRLSSIVSDLLTLVHADSRTTRLNRERMSLAEVVKDTQHRLAPIAEQNGQEISLNLTDSCDMYADKAKLQQVVYNLMENAVKYTPQNGWVKVGLQRVGRNAVLTVTDSGNGIPRDSLPHIFERFYRVDKARGRESGGTGLGLSIVQQYVNLHGGNVSVASEEGQGAVFTVELPLNKG
ncbi:MAG: cell wall metabolism sensor histidine kinase WalK [Clostridiales bacterium]|nr:cell wall metabolism sensor histidine kinase WalK [Clostridiales bacterium]